MQIGKLKPVTTNFGQELHGEIRTLQMQIKLKLIPNRMKTSENAPDYIVCCPAGNTDIPIGGAWLKRKSQIGDIDFEFLSITIDDPSLPNALNVAAFRNNDGDWEITWRRRQQGTTPTENLQTA